MQNEITINRNGQEIGPLLISDVPNLVAAGQLKAADMCWKDGMAEWQPIGSMPEFAHLFGSMKAAAPQPSAAPSPSPSPSPSPQPQARLGPRMGPPVQNPHTRPLPIGSQAAEPEPRSKAKIFLLCGLAGAAVLTGAFLLMTWSFGSGAKTYFEDTGPDGLASNIANSGILTYRAESYERGLMRSVARGHLVLATPDRFPSDGIPVKADIYHGPVLTGPSGTRTGSFESVIVIDQDRIAPKTRDAIRDLFGGNDPIRVVVTAGLDGDGTMDGEIAKAAHDGVTFDGGKFNLIVHDEDTFSSTAELGEIVIDGDGSEIRIAASSLVAEVNEVGDGIVLDSVTKYELPKIGITGKGSSFSLSGISAEAITTSDNEGRVSSEFTAKLEKLAVSGEELPVALDGGILISMAASKMDAKALSKLSKAYKAMQRAVMESNPGDEPPEEILSDFFDAYLDLIRPDLRLKMKLVLSGGDESGEVRLGMGFGGDRPMRELETMRELFNATEADASVRISQGLITGPPLDEMLAKSLQDGTVIELGENYGMTFEFKDGVAKFNQQPLPLPDGLEESLDAKVDWKDLMKSGPGGSPFGPGGGPPPPGFGPDPNAAFPEAEEESTFEE